MTYDDVMAVFTGSNGDATRALFMKLSEHDGAGAVAVNLFRVCKASGGGKRYRGSSIGKAYAKKDWAMGELVTCLGLYGADLGITWGWGYDPKAVNFEHVLYVEIPTGQVSFHTAHRRAEGGTFPGEWDRVKDVAHRRICRWIESILTGQPAKPEGVPENAARQDRTEGAATASAGGAEAGTTEPGRPEGERQEAFEF